MKKHSKEGEEKARVYYGDLETLVREKVKGYIQDILEEEVTEFLGRGKSQRRKEGVDMPEGYRNGHGKVRKLALMNGTVTLRRPRVRDNEGFESRVLPLFQRKSEAVKSLLPELYLHGLAQKDFELALRGLLGDAAPLSAASIGRLKAKWHNEYEAWKMQDLTGVKIVYQWVDGVYVKAGLEKDKAALLVILGADTSGKKLLLACEAGFRESKEGWSDVLRDLIRRGLKLPKLTVADGNLGIWAALQDVHPQGDEQRCWNHKIVNVLDAMPKRVRAVAAEALKKIPYADTRKDCERLRDAWVSRYEMDYPKACEKLLRDWERMVSFYAYPKEHWIHLRTSNVVESPFNVIRLRTNAARRFKKVSSATAMLWKLLQVAQKTFRKLNYPELLPLVYEGKMFADGVLVQEKRSAA